MISIDLGAIEYYDDKTNQFLIDTGGVVRFEYSLLAIYNWEAKWKKPFLKGNISNEELIDFFMTMALDPIKKEFISLEVAKTLTDYIEDSHTATTFSSFDEGQNGNKDPSKGKLYTSEELYALMFSAHVPLEFESRNLNRLLVVLRIIGSFNTQPKKMSKQDIYRQNKQLNEARKQQMKSKG